MVMPLAPDYFTADMVRALPDDGKRYEVVWGELLVTPSPVPMHQRVVSRLLVSLHMYCDRHGIGEVLTSPADISWGEDILVQPDVFVIAREEAGARDWASVKTLRLVVEVLSPSTARRSPAWRLSAWSGSPRARARRWRSPWVISSGSDCQTPGSSFVLPAASAPRPPGTSASPHPALPA